MKYQRDKSGVYEVCSDKCKAKAIKEIQMIQGINLKAKTNKQNKRQTNLLHTYRKSNK